MLKQKQRKFQNVSTKKGYMMVERKGFLRQFYQNLSEKLHWQESNLPALDEVLKITGAKSRVYLGVMEIELDKIIGSEGRAADFAKDFVPLSFNVKQHMRELEKLIYNGAHFPPVSLYKLDDYYFVCDGNHRVAIAKAKGQIFIDAEVTEIYSPVPITRELSKRDIDIIRAHVEFLKVTDLISLGREANINMSREQNYQILLDIIGKNAKKWGLDQDNKDDFQKAARRWYLEIFASFSEDAYRFDLLARFPKKSTGDLYVWVQSNWHKLKAKGVEKLNYLNVEEEQSAVSDAITDKELLLFNEVINNSFKLEDNFILSHHIGISIVNLLLYLELNVEPKIVIVKRRYHPFEKWWSLPISMLRPEESFQEAAKRCLQKSLGYNRKIVMQHFCTHDKVDRHPLGRCIGEGMMGFIFADSKTKFYPGHLSDEVDAVPLHKIPQLVFDHNDFVVDGLDNLLSHANEVQFLRKLSQNEQQFLTFVQSVESIANSLSWLKKRFATF